MPTFNSSNMNPIHARPTNLVITPHISAWASAGSTLTTNLDMISLDCPMICIYPMEPCRHLHDDVIKWKHFPRYWPSVRGIHRSPVNSPHKGQWRGALMFSLICVWLNGWENNREAGDLRRYRAHYDVIAMKMSHEISGNLEALEYEDLAPCVWDAISKYSFSGLWKQIQREP